MTLTFDLLTLKSVWESHVTWDTPVQSFVFLGLLVFELRVDVRDIRRTTDVHDRLMPPLRGGGIIMLPVWLSGNALVSINVVTLRHVWLAYGRRVNHLGAESGTQIYSA